MAGEPRDTLGFAAMRVVGDAVAPVAAGVDRAAVYRRGALARAVMMAGAMERALDTAVTYAGEEAIWSSDREVPGSAAELAVMAGQVAAAEPRQMPV